MVEYPSLSFLPLYTYIRALPNDSISFKQSEYEQDRGKNCILSVPALLKTIMKQQKMELYYH
jgi:hypothetical protein